MIAAFRKRPAWLAVPAVGMLLAVGAATLTSAVTVVAADVAKVNGGSAVVNFTATKPSALPPAESPKELDTPVAEINVDEQGLDKVLSFLAESAHLNLAVNWQALQNAGIDKNTPVTLHLKNVPLHKVLDVAFSQLGQQLGYEFSDNVLTISTAALLPANGAPRAMDKVVKVYNVRDLVGNGVEGAGVPMAPGTVVDPATGNPAAAVYSDTQKLEQVIMSTVEPTSWVTNGGSAGSMQDFHGLITVTATQGVQDQVAELLDSLRKADKEQGKK